MDRTVSFLASLADRSGFSRDRTGGTLRLDIPETEIPNMIALLACPDALLAVTIEIKPSGGTAVNSVGDLIAHILTDVE